MEPPMEIQFDRSCRVYVGNIPWKVTDEDLMEHMSTVGPVVSASIFHYKDGVSKGCGIVTYENAETAQRAISELMNSDMHGRKIFVREDREQSPRQNFRKYYDYKPSRYPNNYRYNNNYSRYPPRYDNFYKDGPSYGGRRMLPRRELPTYAINVINIPYKMTKPELFETFQKAGGLESVYIMKSQGAPTGRAICYFNSKDSSLNAISLFHDTEIGGRKISVETRQSRPRFNDRNM